MFDTHDRPVNLAYSSHWPFAAALVWIEERTLDGTLKEWSGGDSAVALAPVSAQFPNLLEKLIAGRVPSRAWMPDGHSRALDPFEWLSVYLSWGSEGEGRADRWHPYINKRPDTSTILFRNAIFDAKALMREFPAHDIPTPFLFDGDEPSLTLMQAAAFTALGGKSGLATLDQIESAAADRLFPALRDGDLEAQAISTSTLLPVTVPAERWHIVTTDPSEPGHLVEWTDRMFKAFGSGALTAHEDRPMVGPAALPTWAKVTIRRADLNRWMQAPAIPKSQPMPVALAEILEATRGRKAKFVLSAIWACFGGPYPRQLSALERYGQVFDQMVKDGWNKNDRPGKETFIAAFKAYDRLFPG